MNDSDLIQFAANGLRFPQAPADDGYYTSEDTRLYFATFGEGHAVVLLHGGMGNCTNWALQIQSIIEHGYRAIVMDTRGHGRSTVGTRPFSYTLFAKDVERLLDHLGIVSANFVGWSDGACTALELARMAPAKVTGIVFFACNVTPDGTKPFVMTPTIEHCIKRHQLDFERFTPTLEDFSALQPRLEPMQKNEPNYSLHDLKQFSVPVAVILGEHDEFIKREHAEFIAKSIPAAHFELMPGVSHFAPIQNPALFNTIMLKYIQQQPRKTD